MHRLYFSSLILIFVVLPFSWLYAQVDITSNLSDTEKLWGLTKFWSEAKYNFAYFDQTDVNWDSAYQAYVPQVLATKSTWDYYQVLKRFCALLSDGHTNVYIPHSLYTSSRYRQLVTEFMGEQLYVTNVPQQYAEQNLLGAEVLRIDGEPTRAWMAEHLLPYVSASAEHQRWNTAARQLFYGTDTTQTWQLTLRTSNGDTVSHATGFRTQPAEWVVPQPKRERFSFRQQDSIGIIAINTFGDEAVISDFENILPQLRTSRGIVIDLRKNGGGSSNIGAEILSYFTDAPQLVGSTWKTREHLPSYKAWGTYFLRNNPDPDLDSLSSFYRKSVLVTRGDYWHQGDTMTIENSVKEPMNQPLVVLTSNHTASAAEDFLIMLRCLPNRATIIGQKTFGSTGQPLPIELPGGGSARVCTKRDTYPSGQDFVGIGVIPDIEVERTVA
ncbi:MAG: S41 family peptidase [Bacteroidota bacterium]